MWYLTISLTQMSHVKCCFITTDMGCILSLPSSRILVDSHVTNKYKKSIMSLNVFVFYNMGLSERKTQGSRDKLHVFMLKSVTNRQSF